MAELLGVVLNPVILVEQCGLEFCCHMDRKYQVARIVTTLNTVILWGVLKNEVLATPSCDTEHLKTRAEGTFAPSIPLHLMLVLGDFVKVGRYHIAN